MTFREWWYSLEAFLQQWMFHFADDGGQGFYLMGSRALPIKRFWVSILLDDTVQHPVEA